MKGKLNVFEAHSEGPKIQEACFSFLKTKNNIYIQKTKDEFYGSYYEKSKTGTWSTSSLIPHREDIIPRWSQLLKPLFRKGARKPW